MSIDATSRAESILLAEHSSIAHYRILSRIGSGGMGDVYKALDTKLDRNVALKILRPELLRNPDKVRRFVQEAKAASALNHPALVTVYEVGEAEVRSSTQANGTSSVHYIAMEYVEGESLRNRLPQMPLPKVLEFLSEVADGMAKAHAAGVVHRDLKPDNIMVTTAGIPKIVDFGLAKLIQTELFNSEEEADGKTISLHKTHEGMVLGTIGYMSPEQVEGHPVDHRSDIFSLGCILYEAVTGRRAFQSSSSVETLHQILSSDPPAVTEGNPAVPVSLERITRRCLAKDPDERYQSIKEVAIELREVLRAPRSAEEEKKAAEAPRRRYQVLLMTIALIVAVAAATAVAVLMTRPQRNLAKYRFTPLATSEAYEGFPTWSADGKSVAYIGEVEGILQVFVRSLDSPTATQITHAARDCRDPFWDPHGDRIYYISLAGESDSLWSVGVGGGSPEVVLQNVYTATISPDGRTLVLLRETFGQGNFNLSMWISSPPGAEPKPFQGLPTSTGFASGVLRFAPDGKKIGLWAAVRFPASSVSGFDRVFVVIPFPSGQPRSVNDDRWSASRPYPFTWMADSRNIVFGGDSVVDTPGMHLWVVDTVTAKIRPLTVSNGNEYYPAISPDDRKIVFTSEEDDFDLVTVPLDGSAMKRLLSTMRSEKAPVWSPAKPEFAFVTDKSGSEEIWLRSEDGGWERPIVTAKDFDDPPTSILANLSFSPDGQRIAYQRRGSRNYRNWISPVAGGQPVPLVPLKTRPRDYEDTPTWSPDGDWVAYTATTARPDSGFSLWKIRVGAESPVLLKEEIVYPSLPQWSPRGDWITVETREGFSLLSPDGSRTRVLSEETWLAHVWSRDGSAIYGIRMSEELHLILAKIDIETGHETFVADLGPSPPIIQPVQGLSLSPDGKTLLSSIARLKGDLWMLEGFSEEGPIQKLLSRVRN